MVSVMRFVFLLLLMGVWAVMGVYWLDSLWGVISTTEAQARVNFKVTTVGLLISHLAVHLMMLRIMKKPTRSHVSKSEPPVRLEPRF